MKIALVTGASSGMGKEFVLQIAKRYPWLDEVWAAARSEEALAALKRQVPKVRILALDITEKESVQKLKERLKEKKPVIEILVNSAGAGVQKKAEDTELEALVNMTELNCTALTAVTKVCLPYCGNKSKIFCLSSGAAFVPQPGFAVYAASKSYVLSFARALNRELGKKATVTAVCPGPVDTGFLDKMGGREHMPGYKKFFIAAPGAVVKKALKDGAKGKDVSVYGGSMKMLRVLSRIIPHHIIMDFIWK